MLQRINLFLIVISAMGSVRFYHILHKEWLSILHIDIDLNLHKDLLRNDLVQFYIKTIGP